MIDQSKSLGLYSLLLLATIPQAHAQLGPLPIAGQSVEASGGTVSRALSSKLGDTLSLLDFGAKCDGVTDDSKAIITAGATGRPIGIPTGLICNAPSLAWEQVPAVLIGPGKVRTSDGDLRAPHYSAVLTAPNPGAINSTNSGTVNSSFSTELGMNWDYSHALSAEEFHITGAATLGQPTTGYVYMPGAAAHTAFFVNDSGWNQNTAGGGGRTAAVFDQVIAQQNGQGDFIVHNAELLCNGVAKAGATNYLANPACAFEGGDVDAVAPGQYLQKEEWHFADNNQVAAAMGRVMAYNRTQPTGSENEFWEESRLDCNGGAPTQPGCDGVTTVTGTWRIGLDFTSTGTHVQAPLAMQAGQKITLNGTNTDFNANPAKASLGGDWLMYDPSTSTVQIADNSSPVLRLSNPANAVNGWSMTGSATGVAVIMQPNGSDASIYSILADKGGAGVVLMSDGNLVAVASAASSASSYLQLSPGGTGAPFLLQTQSVAQTDLAMRGASGGAVHPMGAFMIDMSTPASSSAACRAGQVTFDTNYEYFCIATNTWKRAALSSF